MAAVKMPMEVEELCLAHKLEGRLGRGYSRIYNWVSQVKFPNVFCLGKLKYSGFCHVYMTASEIVDNLLKTKKVQLLNPQQCHSSAWRLEVESEMLKRRHFSVKANQLCPIPWCCRTRDCQVHPDLTGTVWRLLLQWIQVWRQAKYSKKN